MFNCRGCGKEFSNQKSKQTHESKCKLWLEWRETILTYDVLYQKYVIEGKSANAISQEIGIGNACMIIKALKRHNIKSRNISEASSSIFVREKYKQTNLERYGHEHNFSKNHPSRLKWEKEMFENEGIVNVFQRPDVIKKLKISIFGDRNMSSIHMKVLDILDFHKIEYNIELQLLNGNKYKYYDVHIKNTNKLIEVNGDFWHANPKKYSADDMLNYPGGKRKVSEIWQDDLDKKLLAESQGYDILYLWENDFSDLTFIENEILKYMEK